MAASPRGVMDGARYIESLRDGREVWLHGEKVADVTKHPAFANVVRTIADLYDLQHRAPTQDVMTYVDDDGVRSSISYMPPTSPEELLQTAAQYRTVDRTQLRHARAGCRIFARR